MNAPRVPHPREALAQRADSDDDHAQFWAVLLYVGERALYMGRSVQLLDAVEAVMAAPKGAPR